MPASVEGGGRVFSEDEHYTLLDDRVARETAQLTEKVTALEAEKSALQTKIDALETEKAQAEQRATAAEQALTDYKNDIEAEKAREAKRADRKSKLAEANPYLEINEDRENRIVAMSDEDFEAYLADMREVASKVPAPTTPPAGDPPRESAALNGGPDDGKEPKGSVKSLGAARRGVLQSVTTKGA